MGSDMDKETLRKELLDIQSILVRDWNPIGDCPDDRADEVIEQCTYAAAHESAAGS